MRWPGEKEGWGWSGEPGWRENADASVSGPRGVQDGPPTLALAIDQAKERGMLGAIRKSLEKGCDGLARRKGGDGWENLDGERTPTQASAVQGVSKMDRQRWRWRSTRQKKEGCWESLGNRWKRDAMAWREGRVGIGDFYNIHSANPSGFWVVIR